MDLFKIVLTSLGSVIVLFILTKITGNREMSELSMFDYINSITIGSIAAEMATSLEDFSKPLIAMIVYTLAILIISFVTNKSIVVHRFINGKALILLDNGVFYKKNFAKSKINLAEFLTQCRDKGYFNISDIKTAIIEANGKISILPKSVKRPVIPEDLNITPQEELKLFNIILDGKILEDNLKSTGNNKKWLTNQVKAQKLDIKDIFLATCDSNNNLSCYTDINKNITHDPFI